MVIVGGGIAGVLAGANLRKAGVERIRIVDQAGGIGGTWYWNRYPGVMCDVESYIYIPMLEELDYIPTQRYAFGEEIRLHLEAIADRFDLVTDALFHTGVTRAEWDEDAARWRIHTDRGDEVSCRWYVLAVGILNLMKLPDHPGHGGLRRALVPHGAVGLRVHRRRPGPTSRPAWPTRSSPSSAPARAASSACRRWPSRRSTSTCSSARRRPSANGGTGPPIPTSTAGSSRAGSGPGWTTSRRSSWADPSRQTWSTTGGPTTTPPSSTPRAREGMTMTDYLRSAEAFDYSIMEMHRQRVEELVADPAKAESPQAVLPIPVQAAVFSRPVSAGLQPCQRHPDRLSCRDRADHRAGPGRRRQAVRGRLHHLRHRLRGRAHPAVPSGRP